MLLRRCYSLLVAARAGVQGVVAQSNGTNSALIPLAFQPLPLGSIKPSGWLQDQLQLMAAGLAGHEHDFYWYVADSTWLGSSKEYSALREGFPYWFNGLVPLAYALDDSRLLGQVRSAADYVLAHQQEDGWLGPEVGQERNFWGRMPFCLGLMQMAQADMDYTEKIVSALWRFMGGMNTMLRNNSAGYLYHEGDVVQKGDESWGRVRVQDMLITLQWLYESYPSGNTTQLLENMDILINGSLNWDAWYNPSVYIQQDLNLLPASVTEPNQPYQHGVNVGQGLKAMAVFRRYTHNDSLVENTKQAVDWTFTYHGAASGAILADERLAGLSPYYGSETCTLVETMYSLGYLYQALGDKSYADRCEKTAFNALPSQLTPDWWARQYVSQPNQPYSTNLTDDPFWNVNHVGQTYGLETDYPCCTVNHPQGYPKFLSNSYIKVGDNGIAHALLSPGTASAKLNSGNVKVECMTTYPFGNTLTYTITSDSSFDFYVRVPSWVDKGSSSVRIANDASQGLSPDPQSGLHKVNVPLGTITVIYNISPPSVVQEKRANDTIAVSVGALVYAMAINSTNSSAPAQQFNTSKFPDDFKAPAEVRDWHVTNTSAWNYAIDPTTLTLNSPNNVTSLANPIWAPGAAPSYITAKACLIDWGLYKGVPDAPPTGEKRKCIKNQTTTVRLEPLGGAKLHIVDLPTIDLSGM